MKRNSPELGASPASSYSSSLSPITLFRRFRNGPWRSGDVEVFPACNQHITSDQRRENVNQMCVHIHRGMNKITVSTPACTHYPSPSWLPSPVYALKPWWLWKEYFS